MPKRILHVLGEWTPGGITRFVESILRSNGKGDTRHDVLLLQPDGPKPEVKESEVHELAYRRTELFRYLRQTHRLYRQYDGLMIHKPNLVTVLPLVFSNKRCFLFQHGMSFRRGSLLRRFSKWAWLFLLPRLPNTRVICSTEFAYTKLRKRIRVRKSDVDIIPFGISLSPLKPERRRSDGRITIGMAGRLVGQKRHDLVIRSLAMYRGQTPIRLLIAGDGEQREELLKLARFDNPRVEVVFLGQVDDMHTFYDRLDLLLFPSRRESFGLVVPEAFDRGVPVAVFPDVGGCLPLVRDGENGFVLQEGAAGLEVLWKTLDEQPFVLDTMRWYVAQMDLTPYDIARTRERLEALI